MLTSSLFVAGTAWDFFATIVDPRNDEELHPILEPDRIRLVTRLEALRFWREWIDKNR